MNLLNLVLHCNLSSTEEYLLTVLFSMKLLRKSSISVFPSKKSSAILSDSSSASCAATFNLACRALALQLWKRKSSTMLVYKDQKTALETELGRNNSLQPYEGPSWGNLDQVLNQSTGCQLFSERNWASHSPLLESAIGSLRRHPLRWSPVHPNSWHSCPCVILLPVHVGWT